MGAEGIGIVDGHVIAQEGSGSRARGGGAGVSTPCTTGQLFEPSPNGSTKIDDKVPRAAEHARFACDGHAGTGVLPWGAWAELSQRHIAQVDRHGRSLLASSLRRRAASGRRASGPGRRAERPDVVSGRDVDADEGRQGRRCGSDAHQRRYHASPVGRSGADHCASVGVARIGQPLRSLCVVGTPIAGEMVHPHVGKLPYDAALRVQHVRSGPGRAFRCCPRWWRKRRSTTGSRPNS